MTTVIITRANPFILERYIECDGEYNDYILEAFNNICSGCMLNLKCDNNVCSECANKGYTLDSDGFTYDSDGEQVGFLEGDLFDVEGFIRPKINILWAEINQHVPVIDASAPAA
jgi:hypothetical protein